MRKLFVPLVLALLTMVLPATAQGATRDYIVVLGDRASGAAYARQAGVRATHVYSSAIHGFAAPMTDAQAQGLRDNPAVDSIELDQRVRLAQSGDVEPAVQPAQVVTPALQRIGADVSPSANIDGVDERIDIDVAVIDTGLAKNHPDLDVVGGRSCIGSNPDAWGDGYGHGTHVGGLVGAIDNDIGVVGVAPGARLWSARVLDSNGFGSNATVLCGVDWVTAHADTIEVANMSLGGFDPRNHRTCAAPPKKLTALHRGVCRSVDAGVTYVVAAGNDDRRVGKFTPAAFPEVITVSALTDSDGLPGGLGPKTSCSFKYTDDRMARFSNWGGGVDIAAPGICVQSTYPEDKYRVFSGTSMASPLVAGAAALYVAAHPTDTPVDVRDALVALREIGHIPGDKDAFDEGILDVSTL